MSNNFLRFFTRQAVPLAFAGIFLIWGSTFLAVAYGLKGFPPFLLSAIRFLLAGAILLTIRAAKGESLFRAQSWRRNAVTGGLILVGGTGLVAWSEQYVSSAEAAIMGATAPFWFIAIDRARWRHYLADKLVLAGLSVGFAGLLLFMRGSMGGGHSAASGNLRTMAFVVLALSSVSWVLGSLYTKRRPAGGSSVLNAGQQLLAGGAISLVISLLRGEGQRFSVQAVPLQAWLGLLFLIVMGSVVAYQCYLYLLDVRPPALVSVHTYINPVVAVAIGWLLLGEHSSGGQLAGLAVILAGVLLTNWNAYGIKVRTKVRIRRAVRQAIALAGHMVHGRFGWLRSNA